MESNALLMGDRSPVRGQHGNCLSATRTDTPFAQQSDHGLDVVYGEGTPRAVTTEIDQGEFSAVEPPTHDPHEGLTSGPMVNSNSR